MLSSLTAQVHIDHRIPGALSISDKLLWLRQALESSHSLLYSDGPPFGSRFYTLPELLHNVMMSPDPGFLEGQTRALHMALRLGWVARESAGL
jgi:hypothetical protein